MSRRKNFWQSHWQMELSPRKNVEQRIVGIRSTFRGSTFFRLVEIRPKGQHFNGRNIHRPRSPKKQFSWTDGATVPK